MKNILQILLFISVLSTSFMAMAIDETGLKVGVDLYAVQTNLMPYKGYENDLSATFYLKYNNYRVVPFVRGLLINYYFLNEVFDNSIYNSDRRSAAGAGLDLIINPYLKFRIITETIDNKLTDTNYAQESYGFIYNQYISLNAFDLNNYLESFYIPRISNSKLGTFFRLQALKTYSVAETDKSSHAVFPFFQLKVKANDETQFGVSGNNASLGLGYKFFKKLDQKSNIAFLLEGHSLIYQSTDFNSDWYQSLVALQYIFN